MQSVDFTLRDDGTELVTSGHGRVTVMGTYSPNSRIFHLRPRGESAQLSEAALDAALLGALQRRGCEDVLVHLEDLQVRVPITRFVTHGKRCTSPGLASRFLLRMPGDGDDAERGEVTKLLSTKEMAGVLGITPRTLTRYVQRGILKPELELNSRTWRWDPEKVKEALRSRQTGDHDDDDEGAEGVGD